MVWLNSRGSLSTEDQQHRLWHRAPQFNGAKKAVVEVLGFDKPESGRVQSALSSKRRTNTTVTVTVKSRYSVMGSVEGVETESKEKLAETSMDVQSSGDPQSGSGTVRPEETTTQQQIPDYEACIKDIYGALNSALMIMHSVDDNPDSHAIKLGKYLLTNGNTSHFLNSESSVHDLQSDKGELYIREDGNASLETSFVVGRVDNLHQNVVGLNRPNRNKNKSKGTLKNKTGPSPSKPTPSMKRSPSKGILLSAQDGARE